MLSAQVVERIEWNKWGAIMAILVSLGLGSIIFLSAVSIAIALVLRGTWEKLSPRDPSHPRKQ
jgi:hypothetical protein